MARLPITSAGLLLVAGLAISTSASAQKCDCTQATLVGSTVTLLDTVTANAAPVSVLVKATDANTPFELNKVGWGLRPPTNTPALFNIDIERNYIRVNFLSSEGLTVSGNGGFTISGLNPKLASGCRETPAVAGATVILGTVSPPGSGQFTAVSGNRKPDYTADFGQTFSAHQVSVRLARLSGPTQWTQGESLQIDLTFACAKGKR